MKTPGNPDDLMWGRIWRRLLSSYTDADMSLEGPEALEALFLSWQGKWPYGLVCLDIRMPGRNRGRRP